jgi:hypothetical protein
MRSFTSFIRLFFAAFVLAGLAACSKAPSNLKVMMTKDCGVNWEQLAVGSRIPTAVGACEYFTNLPDYPMQGDAKFKTQFEKGILANVEISYDYEITEGIPFLKEAKFLGKTGANTENNSSQFETAENMVIDLRLKELVTSETVKQDVVQFNGSVFEDELLKKANDVLKPRGVRLNSITFVVVHEAQTRNAIDAATAMQVYRNKNMETLGEKLVVAKAGATTVVIQNHVDDKK